MVPIEHKNQRVLLTSQLAEGYRASVRNISDNFNNHRERFIEGKHYFLLKGDELRDFKNHSDIIGMVGRRVSLLYLWTEKGALRHAKILDTDKAWEVYERLEETYFRVREISLNTAQLSPQLQLLINMEMEQKEIKKEVLKTREDTKKVKEELQNIRDTIVINPRENWRRETNALLGKICRALNNYKSPKDEVYRALEERARCKLNTRLSNLKVRALSQGMSSSKVKKLNFLDVIANDARLKEIYVAIVKEMAIKYGVRG